MDDFIRDFIIEYYLIMVPVIIALHFFLSRFYLGVYHHLHPWMERAKPEELGGLRYFQKIFYYSMVMEENTFKPVWNWFCFASFLVSAAAFWLVFPAFMFLVPMEFSWLFIPTAIVYVVLSFLIQVRAIDQLDLMVKKNPTIIRTPPKDPIPEDQNTVNSVD